MVALHFYEFYVACITILVSILSFLWFLCESRQQPWCNISALCSSIGICEQQSFVSGSPKNIKEMVTCWDICDMRVKAFPWGQMTWWVPSDPRSGPKKQLFWVLLNSKARSQNSIHFQSQTSSINIMQAFVLAINLLLHWNPTLFIHIVDVLVFSFLKSIVFLRFPNLIFSDQFNFVVVVLSNLIFVLMFNLNISLFVLMKPLW